MSDAQYLAAIEAAKKFIETAEAAQKQRTQYEYHGPKEHMTTGTKECGTAKRASMDLTRQLAKFRKGEA